MPDTLETYGSFSGYSVSLVRRPRVSSDTFLLNGVPTTPSVLTLSITKGSTVVDIAADEDQGGGGGAGLARIGKAIVSAFSAVGAQVALGATPVAALSAAGTPTADAFTRSVRITPGSPVPPGRAVWVRSATPVVLKLAGGGTVTLDDATGGGGTRHDRYAVVDVDGTLTARQSVDVLY